MLWYKTKIQILTQKKQPFVHFIPLLILSSGLLFEMIHLWLNDRVWAKWPRYNGCSCLSPYPFCRIMSLSPRLHSPLVKLITHSGQDLSLTWGGRGVGTNRGCSCWKQGVYHRASVAAKGRLICTPNHSWVVTQVGWVVVVAPVISKGVSGSAHGHPYCWTTSMVR